MFVKNNGRIISSTEAIWTAIFGSIAGAILTVAVLSAMEIFWTDLVRENPHRTVAHALALIPLTGLVGGLLSLFSFYFLTVLSVIVLVAALAQRYKKVSIVPLIGAFPIYWVLIYLQDRLTPDYSFFTDPAVSISSTSEKFATQMLIYMLPTLLLIWFCLDRRAAKNAMKQNSLETFS